MVFPLDYLQHRRFKQNERAQRIRDLTECHGPFTKFDSEVIDMPIQELVGRIGDRSIQAKDVLHTYGKVALRAHEKTNCLTEIMISEAVTRLDRIRGRPSGGLLNGIPISLKDSIDVGGFDTTVGYSSFVGNKQPLDQDGPMVTMLKDMGAIPYVKTNLPTTLLSFESANDVWGRCTNPHNSDYSPGGSTGGEAALLALGGRIGIGSDVAGSVRVPAHFSGIYSLRCSTGRWPKAGVKTSMPGQEGVPSVFSPMARTLDDLRYFVWAVIAMKPWIYDPTTICKPWAHNYEKMLEKKAKFRVGVMRTDGVVDPSPACRRALEQVEAALKQAGYEIVEIDPPSPYEGLVLGSQLLTADGCQMFSSFFRTGEQNDPGAAQMRFLMSIPWPLKYMYYLWVRFIRRDDVWAGLVKNWHPKSAYENWQLVAKREAYRAKWFDWWHKSRCDFLITPPNATPAVPHGAMKDAVSSCGYTFLFNVLDYTAGIIPVTRVDKDLDQLPPTFNINKLNGVAQGAYKHYDATAMHGLPVGVQIVGRRMEEEMVLVYMNKVEEALGTAKYQPIPLSEVDK
ncbi:amidase signature enzyme [Apiospora aurea]|uniref:Amidase signature enzyme n=1 Tax=Apiospora aurea TaxID=335848 RepID=A0ABR1QPC1_9PEZI